MPRFSVRLFLVFTVVLAIFLPASAFAQQILDGNWEAQTPGGSTRVFTFHVNGDTFSGNAGGEAPFDNGKFLKGWFSFWGNETYYTGFVAGDHLDLIEELHFSGYKYIRKPGSKTGPNPFDGEWTSTPPRSELQFTVHGTKLEGAVIDTELIAARAAHAKNVEKYAAVPTTHPFLDGGVVGNELWFKYMNRGNEPAQMIVKLVDGRLEVTTDIRRNLIATRRASSPAATSPATPPGASQAALPRVAGKMAKYQSLAQRAMEDVRKNDLEAAVKLCETLEQDWDANEDALRSSSPDIWGQIDHAMDSFIHPIMRSAGRAPDAAALDTVYRAYLAKLKLAD